MVRRWCGRRETRAARPRRGCVAHTPCHSLDRRRELARPTPHRPPRQVSHLRDLPRQRRRDLLPGLACSRLLAHNLSLGPARCRYGGCKSWGAQPPACCCAAPRAARRRPRRPDCPSGARRARRTCRRQRVRRRGYLQQAKRLLLAACATTLQPSLRWAQRTWAHLHPRRATRRRWRGWQPQTPKTLQAPRTGGATLPPPCCVRVRVLGLGQS